MLGDHRIVAGTTQTGDRTMLQLRKPEGTQALYSNEFLCT